MNALRTFEFLLLTCGTCYVASQFNVFPADFFLEWRPISFYQLLDGPLSETVLTFFKSTWFIGLTLAGLGFWQKILCPIGAISGVIVLGHHYNFGNVYHGSHLYMGAVVMTCFFPNRKGSPKLFLRMMKVFVVFVMCLTGLQKLYYGGGFDWAFSDAFYVRIASNPFHPYLAKKVLEGPLWFSQFLGGYSLIIVELLSPIALVSRRCGRIFFLIWSTFHIGVTLLFTNHFMFYSQIFAYSVFLDFEANGLISIALSRFKHSSTPSNLEGDNESSTV